jgi:CheY-like chemotaxis protein
MKRKAPGYRYKCAMLIDDNELDNYINEKILEFNHFAERIYKNTSGQNALEFLNNLAATDKQVPGTYPEVMFVDLNMPHIDGFQFIETFLRELSPQLNAPRIAILTSSLNHSDQQRAREISEDIAFLNKPLNAGMLDLL